MLIRPVDVAKMRSPTHQHELGGAVSKLMALFSVVDRGTDELLGVMDKVHIVNSTLGKALGGAAGTSPSDP